MLRVRAGQTTKITISLPRHLVRYADEKAAARNASRSEVIATMLDDAKTREEELLAAEGYRFYAREAEEFAEGSLRTVSEVLEYDG